MGGGQQHLYPSLPCPFLLFCNFGGPGLQPKWAKMGWLSLFLSQNVLIIFKAQGKKNWPSDGNSFVSTRKHEIFMSNMASKHSETISSFFLPQNTLIKTHSMKNWSKDGNSKFWAYCINQPEKGCRPEKYIDWNHPHGDVATFKVKIGNKI